MSMRSPACFTCASGTHFPFCAAAGSRDPGGELDLWVLAPDCVRQVETPLDRRIDLAGPAGALSLTAFAVPGKGPLYLEAPGPDPIISEGGDALRLEVSETASGETFYFVP